MRKTLRSWDFEAWTHVAALVMFFVLLIVRG